MNLWSSLLCRRNQENVECSDTIRFGAHGHEPGSGKADSGDRYEDAEISSGSDEVR